MKKKLSFILIIVIIVILVILLIQFKKNTNILKDDNMNKVISPRISAISEKITEELKGALNKVELDYQNAKKSYSEYQRNDFYNSQRMSENVESASLEFVNLNDIDLTKVYDLEENKVENLDLKNLEKFKKIDENLDKLDIDQNFENGKYYLLRVESYLENINLYYLIQFDDNGVRKMDLIFYTEDEIIDDELNEDIFEIKEDTEEFIGINNSIYNPNPSY